jgi:hypothetical protein
MSYRRLAAYVYERETIQAEEAAQWLRIVHDPKGTQRAIREALGSQTAVAGMSQLLSTPSLAQNVQVLDKLPPLPPTQPPSPPSVVPPATGP